MTISIIVAINNTNSIGLNGKLLYKIPSDLRRFKKLTTGNTIVMGRVSFEEIGKALPNRNNIIVTSREYPEIKDVKFTNSLPAVLIGAKYSDEEHFIIGGESIFKDSLHFADKVYLTKINDNKIGDRKFNNDYVTEYFELFNSELHEYEGLEFQFLDYVRKVDKNE